MKIDKDSNYFFLHGFLGRPKDFDSVVQKLKLQIPEAQIHILDYLKIDDLSPHQSFSDWSKNFNTFVEKNSSKHNILIGYSMGARLGALAVQQQPNLWKKNVFVSFNPGLKEESDKVTRMNNDNIWAEKFETAPWLEVLNQWNSQNIFKHDVFEPERIESNYDRKKLGQCLRNWSHAKMPHLFDFIKQTIVPTTLIYGRHDIKYAEIAERLEVSSVVHKVCAEKSGHRILFSEPELIVKEILEF
jgi:2-succinyl-6-hydroxy-2,4-cyclohexadiene-1-carboxylate synthase